MNKLNSNIIKPNKFSAKKPPIISEEKGFLLALRDNTKAQIKKTNTFLAACNHNLKLIKNLLSKVK